MPDATPDDLERKTMYLSSNALRNLAKAASRRSTEREALEDALDLLAARDAQQDAMTEFIEWASAEWGPPTEAERAQADEIAPPV